MGKSRRTAGGDGGIWFYAAPGSGVSINVGVTAVADERSTPGATWTRVFYEVAKAAYGFQYNSNKRLSNIGKRFLRNITQGSLQFDSLQRIYHKQVDRGWE